MRHYCIVFFFHLIPAGESRSHGYVSGAVEHDWWKLGSHAGTLALGWTIQPAVCIRLRYLFCSSVRASKLMSSISS
jgi:hypothetical protein